jgi:hypothetical protein
MRPSNAGPMSMTIVKASGKTEEGSPIRFSFFMNWVKFWTVQGFFRTIKLFGSDEGSSYRCACLVHEH